MSNHTCDICDQPAGYRYKGQWNCKTCFEDRRAMWTDFETRCKTPSRCLRPGMLPATCETCGLDTTKRAKVK